MKSRFSKLVVSFIVMANVSFTTAVLYIFLRTGAEPTVLIGAWFTFTTGELWTLASIKKAKTKSSQQNKEDKKQ